MSATLSKPRHPLRLARALAERFQSEPGKVRYIRIGSEKEVFEFVNLTYREPKHR